MTKARVPETLLEIGAEPVFNVGVENTSIENPAIENIVLEKKAIEKIVATDRFSFILNIFNTLFCSASIRFVRANQRELPNLDQINSQKVLSDEKKELLIGKQLLKRLIYVYVH